MITPWENFVYEGQTANKLAELQYIGKSSNYHISIFDSGMITVEYLPYMVHFAYDEMKESEVERQYGEGGRLMDFIKEQYQLCLAKKASNYSDE